MEWKEVKLGDVCRKVCSGGTPKSTNVNYYGGNIPWLNTKEIDFNRIYSTEKTITEEGLKNSSAKWIEANTITIAMYGATAGKSCIVKVPLTTNQACCNLTIDDGKADYELVYYALKNLYTELASLANGGAQQNLNAQIIKDFIIKLPSSTDDQRRIASILSSLDSKIETNNKINAKLEEMGQALFKSWFVDFEPFKDGKFVDSELGMIPEGWRVGKLGEISYVEKKNVNPSKQGDTLFSHYSLPAFDDNKLPAKQYGNEIMSNKCAFTNRTTLLSKLNPHIKRIWYVDKVEDNPICSTEFLPFKAKDEDCSAFLYSYLVSDTFYKVALSMVQGATNSHQRLDAKSLLDFELAINKEAITNFSSKVAPMLTTICNNRKENLHLSQLRDTLLPKLMNGEIEI